MSITAFMEKHYRHYNARETLSAAKAYKDFIENEHGAMMVSLAGAMSTAELGISLAEMIRKGKIHAISCTAANLEEDLFNLFAHNDYHVIENWRSLSTQDEVDLRDRGLNRVTDTCIPETVMMHMQDRLVKYWKTAAENGQQYFPYEYMFRILDEKELEQHYQIPREHSWMIAAKEAKIPIYSPGIEDSTLGNMFAARVMDGTVKSHSALKSGTQQMEHLANWYKHVAQTRPIGFFQIGGGIAGDFAICAVPMWIQDLGEENIRRDFLRGAEQPPTPHAQPSRIGGFGAAL